MNGKKEEIEGALHQFVDGNLAENAKHLLKVLGYESQRTMRLEPNTLDGFLSAFELHDDERFNPNRALVEEWESIDLLFQLTDGEIGNNPNLEIDFEDGGIDEGRMESYLFFALKLRRDHYTRTELSQITREMNKAFDMPAMILFQHGEAITFAVIDRRLNKVDESKDVLLKATLIKDIEFVKPDKPNRGHTEILFDLWIERLHRKHPFSNFLELHDSWRQTLDTEELNRQFYRRLYEWFKWAKSEARFPEDEQRTLKPEEHVIRLITRLLFVWFIKEKRLVSDKLFNEKQVARLLKDYDRDSGDSYYRAVLQNLFFATLNTEIENRRFSKETNADHRNFQVYRYKAQISEPEELRTLFDKTPFINGGLFDCLDDFEATKDGGSRIDCFSDRHYKRLSIPNRLFFDKDRGVFSLLTHYKFTVEENTPIEQEVALDPELLGKVFENLLAVFNPETGETARKETGSYYTPRPIVDYMVDEALVAVLAQRCDVSEKKLKRLLDYTREPVANDEWFDSTEADRIVHAIAELKILDPAVGSGAFPMSVLHKLTLALRRLDPKNRKWKQLQEDRAGKQATAAFKISNQEERDVELSEISDIFQRYQESDFGRKLYLIQSSIFGVDIQPIACQIAKLRFFISLTIEQTPDDNAANFGIKPLPNLETRLIAANTLIGLKTETQLVLDEDTIQQKRYEIQSIREKYFMASTRNKKREYIGKENQCRKYLKRALSNQHTEWSMQEKRRINHKIAQFQTEKLQKQLSEQLLKDYKRREEEQNARMEEIRKIAEWDPYDQNTFSSFFNPEWMFGVKDGFDVVIGNPPYGAKIHSQDLKTIKRNVQDTNNSNSAALFVDCAKNHLVNSNGSVGVVSFIVPKSLLFAERWLDLAFALMQRAAILVDVEKAFENVKLEQVVFVWNTHYDRDYYIGRKFLNSLFTRTNVIGSEYPKQFQAWICDVSNDEIKLGSKIARVGTYLKHISKTTRGLPLQKYLKEEGDTPVIGGREVRRYGIIGVKGFVDRETLDLTNRKIQSLLQPKVISQRLVAHIQKPIPHIKLASTVDKAGEILSVDTVENTIITNKEFHPTFIACLFNSALINWYAYKFIFCSAIRTMDFDNYYVGKIPVPAIDSGQQSPIIQLADQILAIKHGDPDADTTTLENEIDQIVYSLYELTPEEIAIVEENTV